MKRFSFLLNTFNTKYYFLFIISFMFIAANAKAQTIYSDNDLLNLGINYYNNNKYSLAELYLFAYVERNTEEYQSNTNFQSNIDAALAFASANSGLAGVQGHFHHTPIKDSTGNIIQSQHTSKPPLNVTKSSAQNHLLLFPGKYRCNDGGTYFVKMIKNEIWWYKENGDNNYTSVMHGFVSGNIIKGNWSNIPFSKTNNSGTIILKIISRTALNTVSQTGGFAGTTWNKME